MSPGSEKKVSRASAKTFEREISKKRIFALSFFQGVEKVSAIDRRESGLPTTSFRANGILMGSPEPTRRWSLRGAIRRRWKREKARTPARVCRRPGLAENAKARPKRRDR